MLGWILVVQGDREMKMPVILLFVMCLVILIGVVACLPARTVTLDGREIMLESEYEIIYIERMPCVIISVHPNQGVGLSCNWARWEGE